MDFITGLEDPPSTPRMLVLALTLMFGLTGSATAEKTSEVTEQDTYAARGPAVVRIAEDGSANVELVSPATRFDTVQGVLLDVCEQRGYGEDCARTLLGMLWKESLGNGQAIGDSGKARGWFQIHYRLHAIGVDCAEDLRCSADWTIDYLEYNGYPRHVGHAVQCHNGCYAGNGYAASALRHGHRLWSSPLFLNEEMLAVR